MSFIVRITIPISDYPSEEVFMKQIYFECEKYSPTKEEVIKMLERNIQENEQYPEYIGEELETLEMVKLVKETDWRFVSPMGLVATNTFVNHPQFERQSFSWDIIKPIKIN